MNLKWLFEALHSETLNFNGLYQILENKEIPTEIVSFHIPNIGGVATYNKIYISEKTINKMPDDVAFFVIAHEIAHYLSYAKKGNQYHLNFLASEDFDIFFNHVVHEEILADKLACLIYYRLNGRVYSGTVKQNLHLPTKRVEYAKVMREHMFKLYTNDLNDYQRAVDSLIAR